MLIVGAGDVSGALNMLIQVLKKNHSRNKKIVLETVVSCSKSSGLCEECRTAPLSTWHHSGQGPVSGFLLTPVCWLPKPASAGVMRMYQAKQAFPPQWWGTEVQVLLLPSSWSPGWEIESTVICLQGMISLWDKSYFSPFGHRFNGCNKTRTDITLHYWRIYQLPCQGEVRQCLAERRCPLLAPAHC